MPKRSYRIAPHRANRLSFLTGPRRNISTATCASASHLAQLSGIFCGMCRNLAVSYIRCHFGIRGLRLGWHALCCTSSWCLCRCRQRAARTHIPTRPPATTALTTRTRLQRLNTASRSSSTIALSSVLVPTRRPIKRAAPSPRDGWTTQNMTRGSAGADSDRCCTTAALARRPSSLDAFRTGRGSLVPCGTWSWIGAQLCPEVYQHALPTRRRSAARRPSLPRPPCPQKLSADDDSEPRTQGGLAPSARACSMTPSVVRATSAWARVRV
ncbi:hypothetical protein DFH06DRAFT_579397 [Mycena polygramma]|nr:hypothetical protein DFH06DRAFT_579397 [Mycena polygramma]